MFGVFGGFGGGLGGGHFEAHYRCYPVTFLEKPEAERGDKVFLPPSALDRLAQLHIEYPMLFQIENKRDKRSTHCGVLEFIADEGVVYLPYWMMQNLLLQEGDLVVLRSATLPKGSFVKLQPHSTDFLDISNPRAVLETTLRNFSCLTVGDTIPIHYNNKQYFIDIVEAKPSNAISVIETDCNVDFAPPLDYVERQPADEPSKPDGDLLQTSKSSQGKSQEKTMIGADAEPNTSTEPTFLAFTGTAKRLDGRPAAAVSAPVAVPLRGVSSGVSGTVSSGTTPTSSTSAPGRKSGKLMFRDRLAAKFGNGVQSASNSYPADTARTDNQPAKEEHKEEKGKEQGFKPFQGSSYSLK
jgi:ubiquitin fusion degradation protein 1